MAIPRDLAADCSGASAEKEEREDNNCHEAPAAQQKMSRRSGPHSVGP
jgi:hypothetical protein